MTAIPDELTEYYAKTESQVGDFMRQYWRENPNGDQAGLDAYVHQRRLDAAAQVKAIAPEVEAMRESYRRMAESHKCRVCEGFNAGGTQGLCSRCTAAADLAVLLADQDRLNAVRRHLAQLAASGSQWRGRPITIDQDKEVSTL